METEKHYFKVGLFVLAVFAALGWYAVTFGGDGDAGGTKRYAVYFNSSVDGLVRGAPVKLKGINVGVVESIRFVSSQDDQILALADISDTAPVRADTVATVSFQGITGTTFLSLENASLESNAPPLVAKKGEKWPVIPSRPSRIQSLMSDAPDVLGKVTTTVDQAHKLLSDKNIKSAEVLLPEAHDMLTEAASAFREIKMLARLLREDPSVILRGSKYKGYEAPR